MNLRTVQFWPRHIKRECTVRYLGSEVEDAREISEHTKLWHPTLARALRTAVSLVAVFQSIALDNRNRGVADDRNGECGSANGHFWSASASQLLNLFARNLTLSSSSNWATGLPPVTSANLVPFADDGFLEMPARYRPLNSSTDGHRIDGGVPQSGLSIDHNRTVLLTLGPENRNSVAQRGPTLRRKAYWAIAQAK